MHARKPYTHACANTVLRPGGSRHRTDISYRNPGRLGSGDGVPAARAAPAAAAGDAVTGTSRNVAATTAKLLVVLRAAQATRAAGAGSAGSARSAPATVTVRAC